MITLSVNRGQILFDRFTSMLPRVMVCQNEECDYDDTSSSSDEFKEEQLLSDSAKTGYWGCDCEETISEDESDGGVSL